MNDSTDLDAPAVLDLLASMKWWLAWQSIGQPGWALMRPGEQRVRPVTEAIVRELQAHGYITSNGSLTPAGAEAADAARTRGLD